MFCSQQKTAGKIAGALGTVAVATTAGPSSAVAAASKQVFETANDGKKIVTMVGGAFAAGALLTKVISSSSGADTDAVKKIKRVFPGSMTNKELVSSVDSVLKDYSYGENSLVATSFCSDEVNRVLERDFTAIYTNIYNMGGLAGFPFGGVSAFRYMASHIPDGGSCLVVFAPHVGVDSEGSVGTVERRGRANGGPCCDSAVAAADYVAKVLAGKDDKMPPPPEPSDAQQIFIGNMLLPHAARLDKAPEKMVELPFAVFDCQKKLMDTIISSGCGSVAGNGKIAVLGGIQINTPRGTSDYFLPLSFELFDNKGKLVRDLLPSL